ncbi:DUF1937 family protein [Halodurantibacterium flavum]|uniref:DUF1937 family protein n=1 Tax=Halodurantibacterium flavum TaxID=1382802 RepID=A0ABW4S8F9_9RHOB
MTAIQPIDIESERYWQQLTAPASRWRPLLHVDATRITLSQHCAAGQVYLATPYAEEVRDGQGRWQFAGSVEMQMRAAYVLSVLIPLGIAAVSPVVLGAAAHHALPPAARGAGPDEDAFGTLRRQMLHASRAVIVPDLPGWRRSSAVRRDVSVALTHNMPVFLFPVGAG